MAMAMAMAMVVGGEKNPSFLSLPLLLPLHLPPSSHPVVFAEFDSRYLGHVCDFRIDVFPFFLRCTVEKSQTGFFLQNASGNPSGDFVAAIPTFDRNCPNPVETN
ncbi:hypothetical protein BG74_03345 [Sodalis-like endosymbiont of Proechinophthirus fluctus]|nr:hypothetical protein BG74_03345 [Sodalis-like endosymbiont of Proechinophthirus fluctus]